MEEGKTTNAMIEKSIMVNKEILEYLIKINKTNRLKDVIILILSVAVFLSVAIVVSFIQ